MVDAQFGELGMNRYLLHVKSSILDALKQMNQQHIKFVVVVDSDNTIKGTLTDGDIRRGLIAGYPLDSCVDKIMCCTYTTVQYQDGIRDIIEKFRDSWIEFLPILNSSGQVVNVITRQGFHVLLLKNQAFSTDFDFRSVNEKDLGYEIVARPWGFYKTTILNDFFQSKVIYVMPEQALSLQSHQRREEYWIVVHGSGTIQIGESIHCVTPGQYFFIPKGCKHRLTNTSHTDTLILTEVQLGDYFGEDDIVRYEDQYGRDQ